MSCDGYSLPIYLQTLCCFRISCSSSLHEGYDEPETLRYENLKSVPQALTSDTLSVSRRISGGVPRVGASDIQELSELGVIAVDLSQISNSKSGSHSKFAGSPEIVKLIGEGLNNNARFDRNQRATELQDVLGSIPIAIAFN
ncbi:MAG: alpha/beta hydrolase [Marinosulfonomonas sp.]